MTSAVEKVEIKLDHQIRGKDWYMIDRTRKSRAFEIRYYEEDIIERNAMMNYSALKGTRWKERLQVNFEIFV